MRVKLYGEPGEDDVDEPNIASVHRTTGDVARPTRPVVKMYYDGLPVPDEYHIEEHDTLDLRPEFSR